MAQRINPETIDPMAMNNLNRMNSVAQRIQRIGKGNRKYTLNFDKSDKKFLERLVTELEKQIIGSTASSSPSKDKTAEKMAPLKGFFTYIRDFTKVKGSGEIKVSYDEYEFLKQIIKDSLKGVDKMEFKWYQLIKKITVNLMKKQYSQLYSRFK